MCDKPMTEYLNHKYPDDTVTEQSVLNQVNMLLKRIIEMETDSVKMKAELDSMGEYLCSTSKCKGRYQGVKGLDGDT